MQNSTCLQARDKSGVFKAQIFLFKCAFAFLLTNNVNNCRCIIGAGSVGSLVVNHANDK